MCQTYTFHHLCGHQYIKTIIQCPSSVQRDISELSLTIFSPPTISPSISTSSTSPLLPPDLTLNRQRNLCSDTTDEINLIPSTCPQCTRMGVISDWLTQKPEARFELVRAWKVRIREERERRRNGTGENCGEQFVRFGSDEEMDELSISGSSRKGKGTGDQASTSSSISAADLDSMSGYASQADADAAAAGDEVEVKDEQMEFLPPRSFLTSVPEASVSSPTPSSTSSTTSLLNQSQRGTSSKNSLHTDDTSPTTPPSSLADRQVGLRRTNVEDLKAQTKRLTERVRVAVEKVRLNKTY